MHEGVIQFEVGRWRLEWFLAPIPMQLGRLYQEFLKQRMGYAQRDSGAQDKGMMIILETALLSFYLKPFQLHTCFLSVFFSSSFTPNSGYQRAHLPLSFTWTTLKKLPISTKLQFLTCSVFITSSFWNALGLPSEGHHDFSPELPWHTKNWCLQLINSPNDRNKTITLLSLKIFHLSL